MFCPRCQTLILYPDEYDTPITSSIRRDRQPVKPQKVNWEMRESWLDMAAFWRISKSILFRPSATFSALNYDSGMLSALVYLFIYGSLGQIIGRYWFTLLGIHYGILQGSPLSNTLHFATTVLFTPPLFLAVVFVAAVLVHFVLRILLAAQRPFSATFQVMAYGSGAASIINVIPFVGRIIMPFWALGLYFVGLCRAHQTSKAKVLFALFLPLAMLGFLALVVILIIAVSHVLEFFEAIRHPL